MQIMQISTLKIVKRPKKLSPPLYSKSRSKKFQKNFKKGVDESRSSVRMMPVTSKETTNR